MQITLEKRAAYKVRLRDKVKAEVKKSSKFEVVIN